MSTVALATQSRTLAPRPDNPLQEMEVNIVQDHAALEVPTGNRLAADPLEHSNLGLAVRIRRLRTEVAVRIRCIDEEVLLHG